jgi:hypothetical protein
LEPDRATGSEPGMERNQFLGGNPFGVILRLVILSIFVGIVMSALDISPRNLIYKLQLIERISALGFGAVEGAISYFLIGAVIVVPIWFISRLLSARRDPPR